MKTFSSRFLIFFGSVASALLLSAGSTPAATITVTNGNDIGPGSLRDAIGSANSGDVIQFAAGVTNIALTSGEVAIGTSLSINGLGASALTISSSSSPVFTSSVSSAVISISSLGIANSMGAIGSQAHMTISDCAISQNSSGPWRGYYGTPPGAILANQGGNMTLNRCMISNNTDSAVSNVAGAMSIINSTFSGNQVVSRGRPGVEGLGPADGGGVWNAGSLTINGCTFSGNSAVGNNITTGDNNPGRGGGIYNVGTITITNCTISGNSAIGQAAGWASYNAGVGGGLFNEGSDMEISNSTIASNFASGHNGGFGGGLYAVGLTRSVSSIIALNSANTGPDCGNPMNGGGLQSNGYNLIGNNANAFIGSQPTDQIGTPGAPIDPLLSPLANNGGPTFTRALQPGSPAIDRGDPAAPPQDQRGYGRAGVPDVGAFEFGGVGPHPAFFTGEISLGNGIYYLQFPNGTPFGYYAYLSDPHFIYHFDMGYEYWFDANDGHGGIFFYDFTSRHFFYTSPSFGFPYLYDFSLNTVLYYYPDPQRPGHYTSNPRYFYNFATHQIITM